MIRASTVASIDTTVTTLKIVYSCKKKPKILFGMDILRSMFVEKFGLTSRTPVSNTLKSRLIINQWSPGSHDLLGAECTSKRPRKEEKENIISF